MAITASSEGAEAETTAQTIECPAPGTINDGDLLRIAAATIDDVTISVNESGWTQVAQISGNAGLDHAVAVFIKIASSESGDYTVDISGGVDRSISVQCSAYSGVDNSTPEDATATTTADTSGTTIDGPAITTVTANAFVESVIYARGTALGIPDAPTGYTKFGTDPATNSYLGTAYIDAGATGSEDPDTWGTFSVSVNASIITWAMRPDTGGGLGTFNGPFAGPFGGSL